MKSSGILVQPAFYQIDERTFGVDLVEFQTYTDPFGDALYNIDTGSLVYAQAVDPEMFLPVPGIVLRFSVVSVVLTGTLVSVVLYLETDLQGFSPLSGADCAVGYAVGSARLGVIPSEGIYPTLGTGFFAAAMANEMYRTSNASSSVSTLSFDTSSDVYPTDTVSITGAPDGKSLIGAFINGVFYKDNVSLVGSQLTLAIPFDTGFVPAGAAVDLLFG